ncbi:lytic murein transglycosylase [Mesorhizobium sp. B2-7-2]|nr:lytic murein transglycosylase [Mesorhizobium sp. B2-7-2]
MTARGTPLCPAGHLPLKGGDQMSRPLSPIADVGKEVPSTKLPISPLEGETSGRTERGAWAQSSKVGHAI